VVKAFFSKPVRGVTATTFTLFDESGRRVPASVDQIGDGTWALFPDAVFLTGGTTYTARLNAGLCDEAGQCTPRDLEWRFTTTATRGGGAGDTTIPIGFPPELPAPTPTAPIVKTVALTVDARSVSAVFSTPVMNVTPRTFVLQRTAYASCRPSAQTITGHVTSNHAADVWTFTPESRLAPGDYCVSIAADVYDLAGRNLQAAFTARVKVNDIDR
jgi:Big-like domain-containing protein